jgi:hypothetical protein
MFDDTTGIIDTIDINRTIGIEDRPEVLAGISGITELFVTIATTPTLQTSRDRIIDSNVNFLIVLTRLSTVKIALKGTSLTNVMTGSEHVREEKIVGGFVVDHGGAFG